MTLVEPESIFRGAILVAAPHMDDEVLGCGGTLHQLNDKDQIHVVYATDGARSPAPQVPWLDSRCEDLPEIRRLECQCALTELGIPPTNTHFLNLPDGALKAHFEELVELMVGCLRELQPDQLFIPFRFDRHPDHLALNRAALRALRLSRCSASVFEYFVYYRSRFVPSGDVRSHIRASLLVEVSIERSSQAKMRALQCFESQTTLYFDWQDRPILKEQVLIDSCGEPERFVKFDASLMGATVFSRLNRWISMTQHIEPPLKRVKDLAVYLLRGSPTRRG